MVKCPRLDKLVPVLEWPRTWMLNEVSLLQSCGFCCSTQCSIVYLFIFTWRQVQCVKGMVCNKYGHLEVKLKVEVRCSADLLSSNCAAYEKQLKWPVSKDFSSPLTSSMKSCTDLYSWFLPYPTQILSHLHAPWAVPACILKLPTKRYQYRLNGTFHHLLNSPLLLCAFVVVMWQFRWLVLRY